MKNQSWLRLLFFVILILSAVSISFAQTSWKGTTSTAWKTASNWTNGVPSSTVDAIIGDASFTGSRQPEVTATASCRSLTIGGTIASDLTISKALTITGNLTINSNGTVTHKGTTASIKGNWSNSGTYSATSNNSLVNFIGVTQSIAGANVTAFRKITISTGSTVNLNKDISVTGGSSLLTVSGTLNPGESPTYAGTISALTVNSGGVLHVKATSFAGNYVVSGATLLNAGSIVDYSSTTVNQTVSSAYTYATLKISGSGTKSLAANLPLLRSTAAAEGNIYVNAGTFDLLGFTANRSTTTVGGIISVANNATLKIGGTNSFVTNYGTTTLVVASTVEYSGTDQNVTALTYGNLSFSSSSGAAVKNLPATAFTIAGNLSSTVGSGSAVNYTAAANLTINGSVSIGANTTFGGGSFSITAGASWANSGTFTGSTGTVMLTGPAAAITGAGTHNFNNLTLSASNITASAASSLNISGNLSQTLGNFTHAAGGTLTMTGTGKIISGTGIVLNNLTVSGTVTTSSALTLTGNLSVSGTLTAGSSTIIMNGASKTISGAGTMALGTLNASGSITTTSNFSVATALAVSGSFTATTGTVTFIGSSSLSGTANLFNVTLNGTALQLAANAVLGIANVFLISAGTLNVTAAKPNTVHFNGTVAQNINGIAYHNLNLSGSNTKTAAGAISVNQDISIGTGTTFSGGTFTHIIYEDWINNGTYTAGTGTVQFSGTTTTNLYGATTFNILTINNATSETEMILNNSVAAATVNMTMGRLLTGSNTITITNTRTGPGIILGNIQRTHAFTTGIAYAFEGPDNTITFSSVASVTGITVSATTGAIADFPFGASVSRLYNISVPAGTYNATLRLHYDDANLNGNTEATMSLWKYNGSNWSSSGKTGNSNVSNYVELSGLTDITNRWTLSDAPRVVQWNGGTSSDWNTAANWTIITGSPSTPPTALDIVQLGTASFTNQPIITSAAAAKNIIFGSAQPVTLTLSTGGSLTASGNMEGVWSANAAHSVVVNNQVLTINGDLRLSDGTVGRTIGVTAITGTINITGSLNQSGGANLIFSGAGNLNIGKDYNYTSGTFTPSLSTTTFNGSTDQVVAGVTYNHLTINKSAGIANIYTNLTVSGNLLVSAVELDNHANTTITGNTTINAGARFRNFLNLYIRGNWTNNGIYISSATSIYFDGTGTQLISASTFNNFNINKPVGSNAILTGDVVVNGDLVISSGTLDLKTFNCNRSVAGGSIILADPATLIIGANNSPLNFTNRSVATASTVIADGTASQNIVGDVFGNLVLRNAGAKSLVSPVTVNGNITIESGAALNGGSQTITLNGNWINNGTYTPSTSLVTCNGIGKTITGVTVFNRLTVYGTYTLLNNTTFNGLLNITSSGSFSAGALITVTMNGDLINSGTLNALGTTNFSGTVVQTLSLINAVSTVATTVNFNGTVSPVLNSTSVPVFATLNINNTGGISPSVGWTVLTNMTVATGAAFNGGVSTHTFNGAVTNNGNINSSGILNFIPSAAATINMGSNFSSTGTVVLGGTSAITLAGSPSSFQNVLITNTHTAGITPSSNWSIGDNFTIGSNSIFNAGSFTYTVGGDLESNGTLNGGTSAFTLSGATKLLSGSPGTTFYDLIITGSIAAQTSFNVSRNFTNNNLFDASLGVVDFTGSGPSLIGGTSSPYALSQFGIWKSSGAAVTLGVNITAVDYLDIESGVLDMSNFSISQNALGLMNIANNATLKIGGTNPLPSFSTYALDSLSTVEYAGSTQTVTSISVLGTYGNLVISAAGTKTANGALNIRNNFTLTNGTFVAGNFTDTLGGNWNMTSGVFTNTGTTIRLNGTGVQNISSTGAFNNLTIHKTAGNTLLATNITVSGTLNFIQGNIQTGTNVVVMGAAATLSGAASGTGWINGKLQKNFATGTNVSSTMEVGTVAAYTPAVVNIASVGTAGNLTAEATATDHPNIATSGINVNKSVNRYWRFTNSGIVFTNAAVTVNWVAADVDAGATTANFRAGNYSAAAWSLPVTVSPLATSLQATGITTFGDIAAGELITLYSWTGASNTNWNTGTNWSSGAVPNASTNVTIPTGVGNYPILSSGTVQINDLAIQTGAALTVSGATLQISGTISNTGTFTVSNASIELNGTTAQTIPANAFATNTIKNLIISNDVTLAGQGILTGVLSFGNVSGKTFTTGGFLILRSNSLGTARIADITNAGASNGNNISGNVTVERHIANSGTGVAGRKWRLLSGKTTTTTQTIFSSWQESGAAQGSNPGFGTWVTAPGTPAGYDGSSNSGSVLRHDPITPAWVVPAATNTGALSSEQGYMLFVRGDRSADPSNTINNSTVLRTTGTVNQGTQLSISIPVALPGYKLVGNPYASPIDLENVLGTLNVSNFFQVWDASESGNFGVGKFRVVQKTGAGTYVATPASVNDNSLRYIHSGQAFFLKANVADATVTLNETHKTDMLSVVNTFTSGLLGDQQIYTELAVVTAGNAEIVTDAVRVWYSNVNSASITDDLPKIGNFGENISSYRNGKKFIVENRPMINGRDTIFLRSSNLTVNNYRFKINTFDFTQSNLPAFLIDSYLQTSTPLNLNGTVNNLNFAVTADAASANPDRFKIVFGSAGPLPVTFTSVKATQTAGPGQNNVAVQWKVSNQVNIQHYDVEKSMDGVNYNKATTRIATGMNGSDATFTWLDVNAVRGNNFYRIRSIGRAGDEKLSEVVKVNITGSSKVGVSVYPNPVVNKIISMQFTNMDKGLYQVRLISALGQVIKAEVIKYAGGSSIQTLQLGKGVAAGNYRLEIVKPDNDRVVIALQVSN